MDNWENLLFLTKFINQTKLFQKLGFAAISPGIMLVIKEKNEKKLISWLEILNYHFFS